MLTLVAESDADIGFESEPQQQRTKQMAMVINRALHANHNVVEPFVRHLLIHSLLFERNQRTKSESVLWRINTSHIIEWADKSAEGNKYLIVRIAIDLDSSGLE